MIRQLSPQERAVANRQRLQRADAREGFAARLGNVRCKHPDSAITSFGSGRGACVCGQQFRRTDRWHPITIHPERGE